MPDEQTPDEVTEAAAPTPTPFDPQPDNDTGEAPTDVPNGVVDETDETDEEPEPLPPSTVHSAAAAGFTEEDAKAGEEEYGEFFIGMWGEKPNFGCPYCYYASLEGSGDIELHILSKIDSGDIVHRAYIQVTEGA